MANWELEHANGYIVLRRGDDWVTTLAQPRGLDQEGFGEKLALAEELVADANRGIESAEVAAMVDRACDGAREELSNRSPAWTAANLAREAVLVLTMDRPEDMGDSLYARSITYLGKAMEQLQCLVATEGLASPASASPAVEADDDGGNIG